MPQRILVIRHGALGDIVQAFGFFAALRGACPQAWITLLTEPAFAPSMRLAPWFDAVAEDRRLPLWGIPPWRLWRQARHLTGLFNQHCLVVDAQQSGRTRLYRRLDGFWRQARGLKALEWPCAERLHHHGRLHTSERQKSHLRCLGVLPVAPTQPLWLFQSVAEPMRSFIHALAKRPFVVLVPGGSAGRLGKRWPAGCFAHVTAQLAQAGWHVALAGTDQERTLVRAITTQAIKRGASPKYLVDCSGRTDLAALALLLHKAHGVVGNDTGTMHLGAALDVPSLTLFFAESDPRRTAPLAPTPGHSRVLSSRQAAQLAPETVLAAFKALLAEVARTH
ncbi:glycosyltransferase family 9 protein [Formicincola oecophyllae]|uniref:glycosyltransferase family 9 protein n=1 Tax=Formicincola oecophyllae TaxID=2558361 RepID=UPI00143D72B1|nr:glycosyltransferase family 9 protein [Formicincola oecophyllae]